MFHQSLYLCDLCELSTCHDIATSSGVVLVTGWCFTSNLRYAPWGDTDRLENVVGDIASMCRDIASMSMYATRV